MRLVIVESPYAGNIERNLAYVRAAMKDCLRRGEAPFASHALYTQPGVLRDEDLDERAAGIQAGFEWRNVAGASVFYEDLGFSGGMKLGMVSADALNTKRKVGYAPPFTHDIERRTLPDDLLIEALFTTRNDFGIPSETMARFVAAWDKFYVAGRGLKR